MSGGCGQMNCQERRVDDSSSGSTLANAAGHSSRSQNAFRSFALPTTSRRHRLGFMAFGGHDHHRHSLKNSQQAQAIGLGEGIQSCRCTPSR